MKLADRITAWARTWRIPSAAELAALADDEAAAVYGAARRQRARDAVLAEMGRRDAQDEARRRRAAARAARRAAREEYDLYVHAAFLAAERECRGCMLSRAGREAGTDPEALWPMAEARALRLASEELRDWWAANGRLTYTQWRAGTREEQPEGAGA